MLISFIGCTKGDLYVPPETRTSTIVPVDGFVTVLVIGTDTIQTEKSVTVKYVSK